MPRDSSLIALVLALLTMACERVHVDEDLVCVVPSSCSCVPPLQQNWGYFWCDTSCPSGEFLPDTSFRVVAALSPDLCGMASYGELECTVAQTGDFELTIHSSWPEFPRSSKDDECKETLIQFDCGQTPPLEPGEWTLKYGARTDQVVVPSALPEQVVATSNCINAWATE